VLNLELLRMRLAKLAAGSGDEKIGAYAAAIDTELRRMARIFDAFFLLSTPPKGEGKPSLIDVGPLCNEIAKEAGLDLRISVPARVQAHESRIREGLKLFFEGASKVLKADGRGISAEVSNGSLHLALSGQPDTPDFEPTKIFKFYYTDPLGNPDLSLAAARLIAETYGGELDARLERDKVRLQLSLPLGEDQ
jgi:hypothetical protein